MVLATAPSSRSSGVMPLTEATPVFVPAIGRYRRVWQFALCERSGFPPSPLVLHPLFSVRQLPRGSPSHPPGKPSHPLGISWGPQQDAHPSWATGSTHHQHRRIEPRFNVVALRDRLSGGLDFESGFAISRSRRERRQATSRLTPG
jgi:hypothetical protein